MASIKPHSGCVSLTFRPNRKAGLSLVELLMVVAIISILAAILIPAANQIQRSKYDLVCLSNLRQIGLGIQRYAQDNDGFLPGPLYTAQYPYLYDSSQLSLRLLDYLRLDKSRTKYNFIDVFVCPAYRKAIGRIGDGPVYAINIFVPMAGETTPQQPFGYPNVAYRKVFNQPKDFPPMKLARLSSIVDENGAPATASTWALKDIDQEDETLRRLPLDAFPTFLPKKAHLTHRNALFFDFHVAPVDQDEAP